MMLIMKKIIYMTYNNISITSKANNDSKDNGDNDSNTRTNHQKTIVIQMARLYVIISVDNSKSEDN